MSFGSGAAIQTGRFQLSSSIGDGVDVGDHGAHVDDRLDRESRHRGTPDVLDRPHERRPEGDVKCRALALEQFWPLGVVVDDDDRISPHATRLRESLS